MTPTPDPGSLHDPTARVLRDGDRVLRVLDREAWEDYTEVAKTDFWIRAQQTGRIVRTGVADLSTIPGATAWAGAVEHDCIPVVNYSSEWTFSMLQDAALLHLDLLGEALESGFSTKDGNPSNIQYEGTTPTFIDTASFTRLRPGEQWYGFRQFCEQFLNPLVLQAYGRLDVPMSVRGSVQGISPARTTTLLPRKARLRPAIFALIGLHAAVERRYARKERNVAGELRAAGMSPTVLAAQVRKLRRVIASLEWRPRDSEWSDYADRSHYEGASLEAKTAFVAQVTREQNPTQVLDLGANDGAFSRLALEQGASYVVAVDIDAAVVERLYRELRSTKNKSLLPLCADLTDLNGGLGWAGTERAGLLERLRPNLVLCLALFHHLAITASIRVDAIVDLLASFNVPVVFELPLPDDPMAARLLARKRDGSVPGYSRAAVEDALRSRFRVSKEVDLPGGTRVMYELIPLG